MVSSLKMESIFVEMLEIGEGDLLSGTMGLLRVVWQGIRQICGGALIAAVSLLIHRHCCRLMCIHGN